MAQYRMQVEISKDVDLPVDFITNTLYFDTDLTGEGAEGLAEDLRDLYAARPHPSGGYQVRVKAYSNPGAGPTGEPDTTTSWVSCATGAGTPGPRDVALCLSFYAGSNVPRKRGRIYVGPWASGAMNERPNVLDTGGFPGQELVTLAEGFSGLGGVNVQWVQYSPTTGTFSNVTDYWIDNEWDTVRSRGLQATERRTGTVDG